MNLDLTITLERIEQMNLKELRAVARNLIRLTLADQKLIQAMRNMIDIIETKRELNQC